MKRPDGNIHACMEGTVVDHRVAVKYPVQKEQYTYGWELLSDMMTFLADETVSQAGHWRQVCRSQCARGSQPSETERSESGIF